MKTHHLTKTLGHYEIRGARAIDGDTIEAIVLLPFETMALKRIRLAGWWAPELHGRDPGAGAAAQKLLASFLSSTPCSIFSKSERKDKYGRIICSLWSNGSVVDPIHVLGGWQLTEEAHRADADFARKADLALDEKSSSHSAPSDFGGINGRAADESH